MKEIDDRTKWRRNGPGIIICQKCHAHVSTNAFARSKHRCKETPKQHPIDKLINDFFKPVKS